MSRTSDMPSYNEQPITITRGEYDELVKRSTVLSYLENWGVDNWDGYELAMDAYHTDMNVR